MTIGEKIKDRREWLGISCRVLANDGWAEIDSFSDKFAVDAKNPRIIVEITEI